MSAAARTFPSRAGEPANSPAFFRQQRAILLEQRDEIRRRKHEMSAERVPDALEQMAIRTRNNAAAAAIEHDRQQLSAILNALARMDAGEYGICLECEQPIARKRLEALPAAAFCINCAR